MNPPIIAVLYQSGCNAIRINPLTHHTVNSPVFRFQRNEHILFSTKRRLFADSTHTASPPWSLICTVLSKQSWKWAQPVSSNNTPSKLLNSLYLPGHYKSFNIYKAFWNCLCHKPSWLFASILGTLTKLAVILPQLSAHSLALPMSHQHFSVCTQRKHWQHWMQHIFWCL